ncbi:hypothetical protein DPMN_037754 [Dreissena polymorpha]|uniref:Uncharacterized protein n=1 Tax=Dreissena polymorpha TaxID=45954 RepID=A0A9D4MF33_DREPO|nr:hypothetical protein DPMN_037754 [Dreissena polymorpha]
MEECQKRSWVQIITDMIEEGPTVLLRLPKIRKAIIAHPEPLMWYSKKRVEIELLYLKFMNRRTYCTDEKGVVNESDTILHAIKKTSI